MMKLIGELAERYAPCSFYVDKAPNGRYRLWVSTIYRGEFESLDEIRAWCRENLKVRRFGVGREPTGGPDIWEGWFDSFQEAYDYAMRHFNWAEYWNKALYLVDSVTREKIFLVRGER